MKNMHTVSIVAPGLIVRNKTSNHVFTVDSISIVPQQPDSRPHVIVNFSDSAGYKYSLPQNIFEETFDIEGGSVMT